MRDRRLGIALGWMAGGLVALWLAGCSAPQRAAAVTPTPSPEPSATATRTATPNPSPTGTPTLTPSVTPTPTLTPTPTITPTPTVTPTPTFDFPDAVVKMQAHCRYGPGVAYLHAGDLYPGDHALVWNRNWDGSWLWIKPDKQSWPCWASAYVLDIEGDIWTLVEYYHPLPKSTLYGPPKNVKAVREGNQVTVTWSEVWMTEDDFRGYMIEARVCQNGYLISIALHTDGTSLTITDEKGCSRASSGKLYAVEKHGYTDPVPIPWP